MINFVFNSDVLFSQHWCGKFQSPSSEWMHLTRELTDMELMVVTEGTLYIADEKNEYEISKNEYILMPPTRYQHGYKSGSCSFYWMHFSSSGGFETADNENVDYESQKLYIPHHGILTSSDRVIILMKQLQDSDRRYHNAQLNNCLCSAILSEIGCQNVLYRQFSQSNQTTQIFNDIVDFVNYHSSENLTVNAIAGYFNYNPKYLSSFFKEQSGTTLKQYILQVKMDSAKAELSDTNLSISQIAYNVGFSDPHNFSNAFKKITGLSPSEYRESFAKRALFYE